MKTCFFVEWGITTDKHTRIPRYGQELTCVEVHLWELHGVFFALFLAEAEDDDWLHGTLHDHANDLEQTLITCMEQHVAAVSTCSWQHEMNSRSLQPKIRMHVLKKQSYIHKIIVHPYKIEDVWYTNNKETCISILEHLRGKTVELTAFHTTFPTILWTSAATVQEAHCLLKVVLPKFTLFKKKEISTRKHISNEASVSWDQPTSTLLKTSIGRQQQ